MTKKLSILGSTGSIGTQAIDVCKTNGIEIVALTADRNVDKIEKQIREIKPKFAAMNSEEAALELKNRLKGTDTIVLGGVDGVCCCAEVEEADTVLDSIVGMAGLKPAMSAICSKKTLALANKETLVAAGELVLKAAKENGVDILPVDSEHSAIFQCLQGMNDKKELKSIILTASGGPFFGLSHKELENVSLEQALKHPNWSMGAKITIDSATMMNKGLELIEAVWLFGVRPDDINIVVHKQSVVHSAVEFVDNSVIAQLGVPDMRIPIQYALTFPKRVPSSVKHLSLTDYGSLTFEKSDENVFECIALCKQAIKTGGLCPCIVNSANEEANLLFRQGKIKFLDIPNLVKTAMKNVENKMNYTIDDVFEADKASRNVVRNGAK